MPTSHSNAYLHGLSESEFRKYMIAELVEGDKRMANLESAVLRIERNTVIIRKFIRFKRSTDVVFGTLSPVVGWLGRMLAWVLGFAVAGIVVLHGTVPEWLREWILILGHK